MPDEIVAMIECGKRYYNPRTGRITVKPAGRVSEIALVIEDKPPAVAKGDVAVRLPIDKWVVDKKTSKITAAYEVKKAEIGAVPDNK